MVTVTDATEITQTEDANQHIEDKKIPKPDGLGIFVSLKLALPGGMALSFGKSLAVFASLKLALPGGMALSFEKSLAVFASLKLL